MRLLGGPGQGGTKPGVTPLPSHPPLLHRKPVGDFVRRNLFVYYVS